AGQDVPQLTANVTAVNNNIATVTNGNSPTAAQVQADLATIPALGTNVSVTGDGINGYRVAFNSGLAVSNTNFLTDAVTGGLTVSTSALDGIAKITAAQLQTN